jgi:hypothetical protein
VDEWAAMIHKQSEMAKFQQEREQQARAAKLKDYHK